MASHPEFGQQTTAEDVAEAFGARIRDKSVLVTGVNPNGLGAAACRALALHDPKTIIMTARTPSKAEAVVKSIRNDQPNLSTRFEVVPLDLSSLSSVKKAVSTISGMVDSIDIILSNAGVMAIPERTLSEDGVELHLATNFLGHFLLTRLLLPQLKRAAERDGGAARVVNITSAGFVLTPFRFSDYNFDGNVELPADEKVDVASAEAFGMSGLATQPGYVPMLAYAHSNVANMLFTKALSDRYNGQGIQAFSSALELWLPTFSASLTPGYRNPHMFYKTPSQGVAKLPSRRARPFFGRPPRRVC